MRIYSVIFLSIFTIGTLQCLNGNIIFNDDVIIQDGHAENEGSLNRVKRQAVSQKLKCSNLSTLNGSSYTVIELSNIDSSVFIECSTLLNSSNYTLEQLVAIAKQAVSSLGNPCQWTNQQVQNLSIVILGLEETQLECLPLDNPSINSIGKSLYYIPSSQAKIVQLYKRWTNETVHSNLTSDNIVLLQGITCGFGANGVDAMALADFKNSISVISTYNCFTQSVFSKLYNLTATAYGKDAATWDVGNVKDAGAIVAGVPMKMLIGFTYEKISAISPLVFVVISPEILNSFSVNQTIHLTLDQLRAIPQTSLTNLTEERRNLIISLIDKYKQQSTTTQQQQQQTAVMQTKHQGLVTDVIGGTTKTNQNAVNGKNKSVTTAVPIPPPINPNNGGHGNTQDPSNNNNNMATTVHWIDNTNQNVTKNNNENQNGITPSNQNPDRNTAANENPDGITYADHSVEGISSTNQNPDGIEPSNQNQNFDSTHSTEAPSKDQSPGTLPESINSSNIEAFLKNIGSKLSTEDIQRIDPQALANPKVLEALANNNLDVSLYLALSQKVDEMLSKDTVFDPYLYASGQNFIAALRYKELTNDQLELVVREPSYKPDLKLVPVIGKKVAAILTSSPKKISTFKKALINIQATDFTTILSKQQINKDFIMGFNGSYLTMKQSRDLYGSFLSDSKVDFKTMDTNSISQLLLNLPISVSPSIRSVDVQDLNPVVSYSLLKTIINSIEVTTELENRNNLGLGFNVGPLPVEYELYERIKNISSLSEDNLSFLLAKQLLTVKAIRDLGIQSCSVLMGSGIYAGEYPALVSTIFDQCTNELTDHCKTLLTFPSGFMTSVELEVMDNHVIQQLCLINICPEAAWISGSVTNIMVDSIESIATNRSEYLLSPGITSFLSHLKISTIELINNSQSIKHLCKEMACEMPGSMPSAVIREKMEYCLQNNVSLRELSCIGEDMSLFYSSVNDQFFSSVTCDAIMKDVDIFQSDVINCQARNVIYACVKELNLTEGNNFARIGSLIDQITNEEEFQQIPKKYLCGFLPVLSGLHKRWDVISNGREQAGFKPLEMCSRRLTYQRLMEVEKSVECSGVVPTMRKKRQTDEGVTCETIYQLSNEIVTLSVQQLSSISLEDFKKCVDILGRVQGLAEDQWATLAGLAKNAYGSDVSTWSSSTITSAAGIITGLTSTEISTLVLNQIESINAVGSNGVWRDDKLSSAFESAKNNHLHGNVSSMMTSQLRSYGDVICGATVGDIALIQIYVICESFQELGRLTMWVDNQLSELMRIIKDPTCLPSDASAWSPSTLYALGNIIGGLTKDDLNKLTNQQIRFISPASIASIPPMQFNGLSAEQLQQLSLDQAARITAAQLKSLDKDKQIIIQNKLDSIKTEISLSLIIDNGADKHGSQTKVTLMMMMIISLLIMMTRI